MDVTVERAVAPLPTARLPRVTSNGTEIVEEGVDVDAAVNGEVQAIMPNPFEIPTGLIVLAKPTELDASFIGMHIYMLWELAGWELGKITKHYPRTGKHSSTVANEGGEEVQLRGTR